MPRLDHLNGKELKPLVNFRALKVSEDTYRRLEAFKDRFSSDATDGLPDLHAMRSGRWTFGHVINAGLDALDKEFEARDAKTKAGAKKAPAAPKE